MTTKRRFMIGDEWLYIKIYSGPNQLERILLNEIQQVTDLFYKEKWILKFYFVRYYDNSHHLRCRFLLTDTSFLSNVLHLLNDKLRHYVQARIINNFSIDIYNREIERYSLLNIEDVETLFSHNSLEILNILSSTGDYRKRLIQGILCMDDFLNSLSFSLGEKEKICDMLHNSYKPEFQSGKFTNSALKTKYREFGKEIADNIISCPELYFHKTTQHLPEYNRIISELSVKIHVESDINNITHTQFIGSLLHMQFNRLFNSQQRAHEFVIYYLMRHAYNSIVARKKAELK